MRNSWKREKKENIRKSFEENEISYASNSQNFASNEFGIFLFP